MPTTEELQSIIQKQADQISVMQQQLDHLKRQLFGRKSEKASNHPDLFGQQEEPPGKTRAPGPEAENETQEAATPPKKRKKSVPPAPPASRKTSP